MIGTLGSIIAALLIWVYSRLLRGLGRAPGTLLGLLRFGRADPLESALAAYCENLATQA